MVGEYDIVVIASYADYPSNKAEWKHIWEIDIVNPCNTPESITASLVGPQTYTLTDSVKEVKFDRFTTEPDWCEVTYTYRTSGASDAIALNSNMASRTFSFVYDKDLRLADGSSADYKITIIGTIGKRTTKTAKTTFSLTLKDPCIDSDFVTIDAPVLSQNVVYYTLFEGMKNKVYYSVEKFDWTTVPAQHNLCGALDYTLTWDGQPSGSVDYVANGAKAPLDMIFKKENLDMVGIYQVEIEAKF